MVSQRHKVMCTDYAAGLRFNIPNLFFFMILEIQVEFPQTTDIRDHYSG
jgi:hypothetical protein